MKLGNTPCSRCGGSDLGCYVCKDIPETEPPPEKPAPKKPQTRPRPLDLRPHLRD